MRIITQQLMRMLTLVLISGLASAYLVRYAPGALVDERELNQRASEETLVALVPASGWSTIAGANLALEPRDDGTRGDRGQRRVPPASDTRQTSVPGPGHRRRA